MESFFKKCLQTLYGEDIISLLHWKVMWESKINLVKTLEFVGIEW